MRASAPRPVAGKRPEVSEAWGVFEKGWRSANRRSWGAGGHNPSLPSAGPSHYVLPPRGGAHGVDSTLESQKPGLLGKVGALPVTGHGRGHEGWGSETRNNP